MTNIASICARGGSKGVPRKNIRELCGKPLIVHTIQQALSCQQIDRVFVSTDDAKIAEIAKQAGAEIPFLRPEHLADDKAGKLPVIDHLLRYVQETGVHVERIIDLDPTSPLRSSNDIDACLNLLDDKADVVITGYPSEKSPYFNMVEVNGDGYNLVKPLDEPVTRRQDAPQVYSMNASIYVWWAHTLEKGLFGPKTRLHVMPRERSVDIDSEIDFQFVEFVMNSRDAEDS